MKKSLSRTKLVEALGFKVYRGWVADFRNGSTLKDTSAMMAELCDENDWIVPFKWTRLVADVRKEAKEHVENWCRLNELARRLNG